MIAVLRAYQQYYPGDSLCLAWKANEPGCQIEFQEINIELAIRAFDKATEKFPRCDEGSSHASLTGKRVRGTKPLCLLPSLLALDFLRATCVYGTRMRKSWHAHVHALRPSDVSSCIKYAITRTWFICKSLQPLSPAETATLEVHKCPHKKSKIKENLSTACIHHRSRSSIQVYILYVFVLQVMRAAAVGLKDAMRPICDSAMPLATNAWQHKHAASVSKLMQKAGEPNYTHVYALWWLHATSDMHRTSVITCTNHTHAFMSIDELKTHGYEKRLTLAAYMNWFSNLSSKYQCMMWLNAATRRFPFELSALRECPTQAGVPVSCS